MRRAGLIIKVLRIEGTRGPRHRTRTSSSCYRAAGFVSFGRTNTPEMGAAATTEPLAYGPTHNREPDHGPGGHQAVPPLRSLLVSCRPPTQATEADRSEFPQDVRPRRAETKPRPDVDGPHMDEWGNSVNTLSATRRRQRRHSRRHLGAKSRRWRHRPAARAALLRGHPHLLEHSVSGFLDRAIRANTDIDEEVEAVRTVARELDQLGHHVEPAAPPSSTRLGSRRGTFGAATAASVAAVAAEIGRGGAGEGDVEPWTRFIAERATQFPPAAVINAQRAMMTFRRDVAAWWAEDAYDLLLTATCLRPAPPLGEMAPDRDDLAAVQNTTLHYSQLTQPFNVTGQPAISLPLATSSTGLPIGLQFVAAYGREDLSSNWDHNSKRRCRRNRRFASP